MAKYVYEHPEGKGFGEHHSGEDLSARPSVPIGAPPGWAEGLKDQLGFLGLSDEQQAALDEHAGRTMADLDMAPGTVVTLATDDDGNVVRDEDHDLELVEWTDKHGDPRRTSISPEFFASHFTAQEG